MKFVSRVLAAPFLFTALAGMPFALCSSISKPVYAQTSREAASEKAFDGVYMVDIETSVGDCEKSRQMMMAIANGRVAATEDPSLQSSGMIDPHGSVSLAFKKDADVTHVGGKFKGKSGAGTWSSPTRQCGGSWRAARRD